MLLDPTDVDQKSKGNKFESESEMEDDSHLKLLREIFEADSVQKIV